MRRRRIAPPRHADPAWREVLMPSAYSGFVTTVTGRAFEGRDAPRQPRARRRRWSRGPRAEGGVHHALAPADARPRGAAASASPMRVARPAARTTAATVLRRRVVACRTRRSRGHHLTAGAIATRPRRRRGDDDHAGAEVQQRRSPAARPAPRRRRPVLGVRPDVSPDRRPCSAA